MAVDVREQILLRLKTLLDALAEDSEESEFFSWRNRAELNETEMPAYVLLDGIETIKNIGVTNPKLRSAPQVMILECQIFYVPLPTENQLNEGMGEKLSIHRNRVVTKIVRDGALADLVGDNGYVEYRGMETDMQTGAEVKGQFRLDFAFAYTLNFNKL